MTITPITSACNSLVRLWSHGPHAAATKVGKCSSTGQPYAQQEENKLVTRVKGCRCPVKKDLTKEMRFYLIYKLIMGHVHIG